MEILTVGFILVILLAVVFWLGGKIKDLKNEMNRLKENLIVRIDSNEKSIDTARRMRETHWQWICDLSEQQPQIDVLKNAQIDIEKNLDEVRYEVINKFAAMSTNHQSIVKRVEDTEKVLIAMREVDHKLVESDEKSRVAMQQMLENQESFEKILNYSYRDGLRAMANNRKGE